MSGHIEGVPKKKQAQVKVSLYALGQELLIGLITWREYTERAQAILKEAKS